MNQTNHFYNLGYGWLCKHCSAEKAERTVHPHVQRSDHEAAGLTELPLACWTDATRQALICPRCRIEEPVNQA